MQSTPAHSRIEEYTIPCSEALLAGTMALMTGHVQAHCCAHRRELADKILINLAALLQDPLLSPGFKNLLWGLRTGWLALGMGSAALSLPARERFFLHGLAERMQ